MMRESEINFYRDLLFTTMNEPTVWVKRDFFPRLFDPMLCSCRGCVATWSQGRRITVAPPVSGSVEVPLEWSSILSKCIWSKHGLSPRESKPSFTPEFMDNYKTGPHNHTRERGRLNNKMQLTFWFRQMKVAWVNMQQHKFYYYYIFL